MRFTAYHGDNAHLEPFERTHDLQLFPGASALAPDHVAIVEKLTNTLYEIHDFYTNKGITITLWENDGKLVGQWYVSDQTPCNCKCTCSPIWDTRKRKVEVSP